MCDGAPVWAAVIAKHPPDAQLAQTLPRQARKMGQPFTRMQRGKHLRGQRVVCHKRSTHLITHLKRLPGIGPRKRAKLLQRFGGVRGVESASVEDLLGVEGISRELAESIYNALH